MKTSELIGPALDWAVAKCEGHEYRCPWMLEKDGYAAWQSYEKAWGNPTPKYSTNWSQAGPIIEREHIAIFSVETAPFEGEWAADIYRHQQLGTLDDMGGEGYAFYEPGLMRGPTPLVAAMRCYVTSKLGDEVKIPEELL